LRILVGQNEIAVKINKETIMCKQKAFTLVELLVVIAIIALLMSILMPALARVRAQAKNVLCQSNLKQWGVCFGMYADEWEGLSPRGWAPAGTVITGWRPSARVTVISMTSDCAQTP
jgi:prepilin-type N-terminal cleavage/methylation domain-containing protein